MGLHLFKKDENIKIWAKSRVKECRNIRRYNLIVRCQQDKIAWTLHIKIVLTNKLTMTNQKKDFKFQMKVKMLHMDILKCSYALKIFQE